MAVWNYEWNEWNLGVRSLEVWKAFDTKGVQRFKKFKRRNNNQKNTKLPPLRIFKFGTIAPAGLSLGSDVTIQVQADDRAMCAVSV